MAIMCLKKYKVHGTSIDTHENEQNRWKLIAISHLSDKKASKICIYIIITLRYISLITKVVKLNHYP